MSQREAILRDLRRGQVITPLEALKAYGCMRLGARIWELKKAGYLIETGVFQRKNKRYAAYRLAVRKRRAA